MEDARLLATLPVLASFTLSCVHIESGNEETLRQWQALSQPAAEHRMGKVEQLTEGNDERVQEHKVGEMDKNEAEEDADGDGGEGGPKANEWHQEDASDPSLIRKHSALLLFLHALANKPSLVHLKLAYFHLPPFVFDRMPEWPHLLSLEMDGDDDDILLQRATTCFPSLTSLTPAGNTDAAIAHVVRLPALEELRFVEMVFKATDNRQEVLEPARGFRALGGAAKLRSIYYSPPERTPDWEDPIPSLASVTFLFSLINLVRITIPATWPIDGLLTHHFQHLRCLELIGQFGDYGTSCPQTDAILIPLVKPLAVLVDRRQQRQAVRAGKRQLVDERGEGEDAQEDIAIIPVNNAANFPSLECLAMPYREYGRSFYQAGKVSAWMKRQLRRSYEYEVTAEWEAECTTLGSAELQKSIMA